MTYASVWLDMPPTANKMWRKGPYGMHPSPEYKSWKTAAATEIMARRKGVKFDSPVSVVIIMAQLHKGRDLDNNIKPILDALQLGGLIENDNLVREVYARWAKAHDASDLAGRHVKVEVRTCT